MRKKHISLLVIVAVLIFAIIILMRPAPITDEEVTKCIGGNSVLYTQLGCPACETQERTFGDNYQYLNIIDCFYNQEACIEETIQATPTWIINEQSYRGVQSIEKLQELTGC